MNKSTKIWLNYVLGGIISALLLWGIYVQVKKQLQVVDFHSILQTGPSYYLWLCILLMPVNLSLEAGKWYLLARSAQRISFRRAFTSYLAGMAFSMVTPNRIGEYPGRILYLQRKNTFRLISVSIFGSVAQFFTLFLFGLLGLIYYNIVFPWLVARIILIVAIIATVIVGIVYLRFETWLPLLNRMRWFRKWFRKYNVYGQLLKRFTRTEQLNIMLISIVRFAVFTAQYLFLLRWMNVSVPLAGGYCMAALFFWTIAIIPSIALAELGERGQVSLFLFHHFSQNTVGILAATMGIWLLNLIIPSIIGSVLLFRMRLLR